VCNIYVVLLLSRHKHHFDSKYVDNVCDAHIIVLINLKIKTGNMIHFEELLRVLSATVIQGSGASVWIRTEYPFNYST
jgi:hypothetical protein